MKRGMILGFIFLLSIFSLSSVFAEGCDLQVSLVNQDPYPVVPGESAKLVFQIDGLENLECGTVVFELLEQYPITMDPGQSSVYTIEAGTFKKDYKSFFLATYKVRVADDALDGDGTVEVQYKSQKNIGYESKQFDINIEDVRGDFEVHVKDYDSLTKILTFEILNIAKSDVEALTVEVPKQDNILVRGSSRNIVGDLDSNEYTTAEFEAIPKDGEIELLIHYSDKTNKRRVVEEKVVFDSEYFSGSLVEQKKSPVGTYLVIIVAVLAVAYYFYKRKKKKEFQEKLKNRK